MMKIRVRKALTLTKDNITSLFVMFYFVVYMVSSYVSISSQITASAFLVISFIVLIITLSRCGINNLSIEELLFYILVVVLFGISAIYNHNSSFGLILPVLSQIFMAISLARTKINEKHCIIIFWTMSLYFIYILALRNSEAALNWNVSTNIISIHLILLLGLYFIASNSTINLHVWLMVGVAMIITIWTGNRGGIISIAVLIIGMLIHERKNFSIRRIRIKYIISAAIFLFIAIAGIYLISSSIGFEKYLGLLFRQREHIWDNARLKIILEYLEVARSSVGNLLFGAPLGTTYWIAYFEGNPHNSYIFAHAHFGIVYLSMIIVLIIRAGHNFFAKRDFLVFVLFSLVLRSFTDIPAFPGIYDALFYYLIFEKGRRRTESNKKGELEL